MPKTYNRQVALDTETTGMDIAAGPLHYKKNVLQADGPAA